MFSCVDSEQLHVRKDILGKKNSCPDTRGRTQKEGGGMGRNVADLTVMGYIERQYKPGYLR